MPGHDPFIIVKDDFRKKLELGFVSDLFVIYFKKEKQMQSIGQVRFHQR